MCILPHLIILLNLITPSLSNYQRGPLVPVLEAVSSFLAINRQLSWYEAFGVSTRLSYPHLQEHLEDVRAPSSFDGRRNQKTWHNIHIKIPCTIAIGGVEVRVKTSETSAQDCTYK